MGRVPVACGSFHSPSKPGKMSPYHTFVRGRCDDSAPYLLPAGDGGTPGALRHAALHVAKPRRRVTAATGAAGAPAVEAQAVQWAQIFCGSHPTPSLRSMRIRCQPSRAAASTTTRPHGADQPTPVCHRHLEAFLSPCGL